jgi:hypothetical protein
MAGSIIKTQARHPKADKGKAIAKARAHRHRAQQSQKTA